MVLTEKVDDARSTPSVLAGNVLEFADAFDMAYAIKHDLESIHKLDTPLTMMTDRHSSFHVLIHAPLTTEYILLVDFQTVEDVYKNFEINDVTFLRLEHNIADTFTNVKTHSELMNVTAAENIRHQIKQLIIRSNQKDDSVEKEEGMSNSRTQV